ncbi:hypothetical protein MAPG_08359 [Magnaporthiopsis poae ATCC 64411]|uniref:Uncharacterized protein n=1 Tax=Magnaporthiopsis poae (strain ATCC 64411 / 73-15) TaxID=644358 RepID=A0A0C4E757_MAGP6|nr:hypothetical protein MAPG_08359 [Magnaporthiopsis poae ATCC 64411]
MATLSLYSTGAKVEDMIFTRKYSSWWILSYVATYGEGIDKTWDDIENDGERRAVVSHLLLHFVELFRWGIYKNYYKDPHGVVGDISGNALHSHLGDWDCITRSFDHCIEVLCLNLMCQSDISHRHSAVPRVREP